MTDTPAEVFCLAEHLCDEMQARGWTTEDVAGRMRTRRGQFRNMAIIDLLMCVHKDSLLIDDETFAGLANAFGIDEQYFRNLDKAWREASHERRSPFTPPEKIFSPASRRAWKMDEAQ